MLWHYTGKKEGLYGLALSSQDNVENAVRLMREKAIRLRSSTALFHMVP